LETFAEYKKRLLGYLGDRNPLDVLSSTPSKLQETVRKLSPDAASKPPAPGKWSAGQIAAHLAESELVFGYRIRSILANSGMPIAAYDQAERAKTMRYDGIPMQSSLQRLALLREWNVTLLRSLTPEQWERFGIHAERGRESVKELTDLLAGHDVNHMQQIERIVKA